MATRPSDAPAQARHSLPGQDGIAPLPNGANVAKPWVLSYAAAALLAPAIVQGAQTLVPAPPAPGMHLAFHDEFGGETLDRRKWTTLHPDGYRSLPGNEEAQTYADADFLRSRGLPESLDPISVRGGVLTLTARHLALGQAAKLGSPYVSGMVTTAKCFSFSEGWVEFRARLPTGDGAWPALWLMKEGTAPYLEIDVVERLGHEPDIAYSTVHSGKDWRSRRVTQSKASVPSPADFHVYAAHRESTRTTFLVDGIPTGVAETPEGPSGETYLIMNLAVGGKWSRPPVAGDYPKTMEVDYVRVWTDDPSPSGPCRRPMVPWQ